MASATGIPERNPAAGGFGEDEPLLGRAGDASQPEGKGIQWNLILGTAVLAQVGVWILAAVIWSAIFTHKLIFFSAHPLLNSTGVVVLTQSILILQPTHTAQQKRQGTILHSILNALAATLLYAGFAVILYNKISHPGTHFQSPHAILGLTTYCLLFVQAMVGFTQYYTPQLYGGVENAKKIYKYHRVFGYIIFVTILVTVAAATQTEYVRTILHIRLSAVIVTGILMLAGVLPRIKKQKFNFRG